MSKSKEVSGKKHVEQVDASLNEPLNMEAPPTIYGATIKPELATAALNLAIDFIKQQQSLANRGMIHHYITKIVMTVVAIIYLTPQATIPRNLRAGSVSGFLYQLFMFNWYPMATTAAIASVAFVCLLTTYSRISETFFKSRIHEVAKDSGHSTFGIDLRELVLKSKPVLKDPQAQNTYVVVYREAPIALISLTENKTLTSKESLVMSVSTIGCRKVYLKSGIIEDMLDWAMLRTKTLAKENNHGESMKVLIDVYSFDDHMKKTLKAKGFSPVASAKIKESRLLGGLFGFQKELWGVQFHVEQPKKN